MQLTVPLVNFLRSDTVSATLLDLAAQDVSDTQTLPLLSQLRRQYTPEEAGILLSQARLRHKAVDKFGDSATQMLFTEHALQQASNPRIRQYRATKLDTSYPVFDMGCGIGADSLAMAVAGAQVTGLDIDPVRIALARHNAEVLNLDVNFDIADVRETSVPDNATIFFDPARRTANGKRIFDVENYLPPLSLINQWHNAGQKIIKLSPGVKLSQLDKYAGGIEFMSVRGALKEAILWQPVSFDGRKATLFTDDKVYHWQRDNIPNIPIAAPRNWLIEPDPALIRAGLVQDAAMRFDGTLLDEQIAYFTTDTAPQSPWVRAWQILDWMPYHLKKLRSRLRSDDVSRITVKKRGTAITPEDLIARLKLKKGTQSRTLVLTRYQDNLIVLICADIAA